MLLTLLVAPALTAQSINGDRERGTLATLQITRLSPLEITLGKLLAAWGTGLVTLGLALPFIAWPIVEGDVGVLRGIVVVLVVAALIGVVCAVSQAISSLIVRSITSALLSYMTVFTLMVGTVIAFFLALPLTEEERRFADYTDSETHSERIWWILAPNPFVVLADAAPRLPTKRECYTIQRDPSGPGVEECWNVSRGDDPLGEIGHQVRQVRQGDGMYGSYGSEDTAGPVWPYGLGFNLALAAASIYVTSRSLRLPAKKIPQGTRIA